MSTPKAETASVLCSAKKQTKKKDNTGNCQSITQWTQLHYIHPTEQDGSYVTDDIDDVVEAMNNIKII